MSEQEFELYLKLLSRCLSLTAKQREQIADELRDHLQERLDELAHQGVSREQAVFQALDEFGDAAVLAAHFTTIAHLKRRRFLMRLSLGSVAALAAAMFVAYALWPANQAIQGPPQLVAQDKSQTKKPPTGGAHSRPEASHPKPSNVAQPGGANTAPPAIVVEHPLSSDAWHDPAIEAALERPIDVCLEAQPLKDALDWIAKRFEIPIVIDNRALEDASIQPTTEVHLDVPHVKLRQALTLLFNQLPQSLGYAIRDGVLTISTVEKIKEYRYVVVYDCRDLVHLKSMYPAFPVQQTAERQLEDASSGGGAMFQFGGGSGAAERKPQQAASAGVGARKGGAHNAAAGCAPPEIPLIRVIRYAGTPEDWADEDGRPAITELGGLIVVNQNPMVHEEIKRILADVRRMIKEGAFAGVEKQQAASGVMPAPRLEDFQPRGASHAIVRPGL